MGEGVSIDGANDGDAGRDAAGRFTSGRQTTARGIVKARQAARTAARIAAGEPNLQALSRKRNFERKIAEQAIAEDAARAKDANRWTPRKCDAFLAALAEHGNVTRAGREIGMATSGAYYVRARNADFRARWDEAIQTFVNQVEANVLERIANGFDKPVFFQGQQCGAERVFNDGVGLNFLKLHRPQAYGDVREAEAQSRLPGKAGEEGRLKIEAMLADLAEKIEREGEGK